MNIAVVYVYPLVNVRTYFPLARRFASTYRQFPPGIDHTLYVYANGWRASDADRSAFGGLRCQWRAHNNVGWDIGVFQRAAEEVECDFMVCLGAPAHFHRANWLDRLSEAYSENGIGLYGCACYGAPLHVRTTVFATTPEIIQSYPWYVGSTQRSRYDFEHGPHSFTRHVMSLGMGCYMVTWDAVVPQPKWDQYGGPTVDTCLIYDQHIHR